MCKALEQSTWSSTFSYWRGEVNDLSKKHIDVEEDYISLPFEPHEKLVCEYHNFVSVRMFFKTKYDIDITSFWVEPRLHTTAVHRLKSK
jgi:hypothetical protein